MEQHTPGPWSTNGCGISAVGRSIAIACPNPKADDGSMPANARLIAAAPDLYEALAGMLSIAKVWATIDGGKNIDLSASDTVDAARAALARAQGV